MTGIARYPSVGALVVQLGALVIATVTSALVGGVALWTWVLVQALVAFMLSCGFGLPRRWQLFSLLFIPMLFVVERLNVTSWVFLTGFIGIGLVSRHVVISHVPLVCSNRLVIDELHHLLTEAQSGRFIDLGCGVGSVLKPLATRHPSFEFVGVENAPLSFLIAKWRTRTLNNCQIFYKSLWQESLVGYQWVYCYLSPTPMPRLWKKAQQEMQLQAWLISNQVPIEGVLPTRTLAMAHSDAKLLLWQPAANLQSR